MKIKTIHQELKLYPFEELEQYDQDLIRQAVDFLDLSYAPYSNFNVATALLLENGEIIAGANQENASYPSGLCAERVAVFQAGAKYPGVAIKSIAITAKSKTHLVKKPAAPCGNCRQAISEYEFKQNSPIELLLMGEKGEIIKCRSLADILPLGFNSSYL